jgi:hypothetical protein
MDPVWPDNVHETGVSPGGVTGSPVVAGEGAGRPNSKKDLVIGPIRGLCALQADPARRHAGERGEVP